MRTRGIREARRRLQRLARDLPATVLRGTEAGTLLIERDLKTVALRGKRGASGLLRAGGTGNTLAVKTGAARASIVRTVLMRKTTAGTQVHGTVGSPLSYVAHHERGGVIHGRPWLAAPTIYARAGDRAEFWRPTRGGNLLGFKRRGRSGATPVVLLLRSVRHRGRYAFAGSLARQRGPVVALMGRRVQTVVRVAR